MVTAGVAGQVTAGSAVVSVRRADQAVEGYPWDAVGVDLLAAAPWRTFRWYDGQQHFSGTYWSITQRDHVIYESRLELAVLLLADFDPSVHGIFAQPFLLRAEVSGAARKHIPDYLMLTDAGPVVVNVKPRHHLDKPKVAFTFAWMRALVGARGWCYDVRCEPPAARLENVRFLSGYRRDWLFDPKLVARLRAADLDGATVGEAFGCLPQCPEPLVRAAVLHLVWSGHFAVDLDRPLSRTQLLRAVR